MKSDAAIGINAAINLALGAEYDGERKQAGGNHRGWWFDGWVRFIGALCLRSGRWRVKHRQGGTAIDAAASRRYTRCPSTE